MDYWWSLDELVRMNELVIDRPKGTTHPRFPNSIYPLDYGYLKGTTGGDGEGVDVWRGSFDSIKVQASIVTVDLLKTCVEVKLIVGCTEKEIEEVLNYHNMFSQSGVLVKRDD
jgi:inorganic pyrophosphatase